MLMSDWRAIMTPPEGHPGQHAYTFLIHRRLPSQFQFSLSAVTLVYLSQWMPQKETLDNVAYSCVLSYPIVVSHLTLLKNAEVESFATLAWSK